MKYEPADRAGLADAVRTATRRASEEGHPFCVFFRNGEENTTSWYVRPMGERPEGAWRFAIVDPDGEVDDQHGFGWESG